MRQLWIAICAAALLFAACAAEPPRSAPQARGAESAAPAVTQGVQAPEALEAALDGLLGFGPGEAGTSLKGCVAAAGLLDWAEDNAAASAIPAITLQVERWLDRQSPEDQALFWLNWPGVNEIAQAIARDMAGSLPLLRDAGSPQAHENYTPARYQRLVCGIERVVDSGLTFP